MRLLLIRHAQTPANVLGQLDTARPGQASLLWACAKLHRFLTR
ncbi:MAG: hypothetical protein ABI400_03945 [Lacisediminihabitans sp.]